jgi:hypothetical protein
MNIEFKEKLLRIVIFSNLLLQPIAAFLAAWYHLSFALVLSFLLFGYFLTVFLTKYHFTIIKRLNRG